MPGNRIVGLIPTRRGSTGVPGKNLAILAGKPMVAYTLEAGLGSGVLDAVFVTTDDEAVADIAARMGATVLCQPPEVSSNESPSIDALQWAAHEIAELFPDIRAVAIMRVTTPLRTTADLDRALLAFLTQPDADSLVAVTEAVGCAPQRLKRIESGRLKDVESEGYFPKRRQELPRVYIRNGAVYVVTIELLKAGRMWGDTPLAYVMEQACSVNINSPYDMEMAEYFLSRRSGRESEPNS